MRTSPSAQVTRRAPSARARVSGSPVSSSSRLLRSRNSASRPAVTPRRNTAPSSGGRQNSPRSQPSWRSRRRSIRSGSGPGAGRCRRVVRAGTATTGRAGRSTGWAPTPRPRRRGRAGPGGRCAPCVFAQPPGGSNSAQQAGSSATRRAMVTRPSARGRATPAFQHSQCSGDWMPTPSQPSVSSSTRTAATSRATATFTVPITATASPSANRHATSCGPGPDGGGAGSSTTDMPPTLTTGYDNFSQHPEGVDGQRVARSPVVAEADLDCLQGVIGEDRFDERSGPSPHSSTGSRSRSPRTNSRLSGPPPLRASATDLVLAPR